MNNAPNTFYTAYTPPVEPKKPRYRYRPTDVWLAVAAWVMGYLYVAAVPVGNAPVPALLVQLLLFATTVLYLTRRPVGGKLTPFAAVLIGVSLALCLSFLQTVNRTMLSCVTAWNTLCWFYTVFVLTGNSRERLPGEYFIGELLTSAVKMPYRAPGNLFGALFGQKTMPDGTACPKSRARAAVGWALVGLALAIVPTVIIILLLSYDESFTGILKSIADSVFRADTLFRFLRDAVIGLLAGALLFGAVLAAREKTVEKPKHNSPAPPAQAFAPAAQQSTPDSLHRIPVALIAAMLAPILAVYIIFFVSQWDYYIMAFTGSRPEELTFSAYAREGFFQLVAVAVINAVFGIAASVLSVRRPVDPDRPRKERTHPVIRVCLAVLSVMTLVLIATALSKMLLYVDTYGLTHKRVYATWLMVLLAVAFAAVLVRQLWTRLNLTASLLAIFLAFFLAIALAPTDALIVRYNVNAALNGNLLTMQGDVCEDSGTAGVLAALDFMEATSDPNALPKALTTADPDELFAVRVQTNWYLLQMSEKLDDLKWYEHNITTLRAKAALKNKELKV